MRRFDGIRGFIDTLLWPGKVKLQRSRRPLGDEEFSELAAVPPEREELILGIRGALAFACGIGREYIYPDDSPNDLCRLPFDWDMVGFVIALEDELEVDEIPDDLAEKLPSPCDLGLPFMKPFYRAPETFSEWAGQVAEVLYSHGITGRMESGSQGRRTV